jgi:cell fate (sporulation/competence/biofilm development) regulator YmcA (YheA/YmcA/DUF963 family)
MATFTSYSVVGAKEDISDIITNISPTETPFTGSIGTEKVHNVVYSWQTDALAAAASVALVEGADASPATLTPTTLLSNTTQIIGKAIQISDTNDAVAMHGRGKESAYQVAKAAKEVKRHLEYACTYSKQTKVTGSSSVARQFDGVQAQIDSTCLIHTGGTSTAMSEANLISALEVLWTNGVDPKRLLVTGDDSMNVTNFAQASGRYRTIPNGGADKTLVNAVDLYVSPFGEVKVIASRFVAPGDSIVYNPEYWRLAVLRNWTRETLAKTGDSTKMQIVGEFGLMHKNPLASALIRRVA